jgi:hypothetical protein
MAAEGNTVSFMSGVASAGIEFMSANAQRQNELRTIECTLAQKQTIAQSLAVKSQVKAITDSGKADADRYYAQAGQSFFSGASEVTQAGSSFLGHAGWDTDSSSGAAVAKPGAIPMFAREFSSWFGGNEDGRLQAETNGLSKQVGQHEKLKGAVDKKLMDEEPVLGGSSAVGEGVGAAPRPSNTSERNRLEREFTLGNASNSELGVMQATKAKDASGGLIPGKNELHQYREKLQRQIDNKNEMISTKQKTISNNIQQRQIIYSAFKDILTGISNVLQAHYTRAKAAADALNAEWGLSKEMASNVFGAASQAMNDCNSQTDKIIDGMVRAIGATVGR